MNMKKVSEYKGDTLYQDPATGELWEMDEGEKTYCWSSVEAWKNAIDWDEQMRADAHSCSANAVFSDKGPAGAGTYCTVCGAQVKSFGH
ncbi:MAG: hypothetical protein H6559_24770 [Lewinellaceae bacterium]|nr:hypothetical protein [Lewinellaceae bacterium]